MGTEAGTRAMRPQATARRPPQRREEAGRCGPEPGEGRGPAAAESRLPAPRTPRGQSSVVSASECVTNRCSSPRDLTANAPGIFHNPGKTPILLITGKTHPKHHNVRSLWKG